MANYVFTTSQGKPIPVIISSRSRLRNITLRPKTGIKCEIRISKPLLASTSGALRFLEQKRSWIECVFNRAPQKVKIKDGDIIEFLGQKVRIRQDIAQKSNFYLRGEPQSRTVLVIGGAPEMMERRIRDFIKREFLTELKEIIKNAPADFRPKKIAIRDTSSRWGSCSASGAMSFSWRLAFAPLHVMRYVVMHELAHRKHMNHSPSFWATVAELYGDGVGRAKLWLSKHGAELHRYF
ncbi:MAG: M48 family metallopeptidase [Rickettsiales bacterium]|jgi:predicted metal-dependent hydrolase|nr:M48 family metallopeptidase [Rickettsiales bacterium]